MFWESIILNDRLQLVLLACIRLLLIQYPESYLRSIYWYASRNDFRMIADVIELELI